MTIWLVGAAAFAAVLDDDEMLSAGSPAEYASFGESLAADGDWLVVGSPTESVAGYNAGAVSVFQRSGGSWVHHQYIGGSGFLTNDGTSVALDGDVLAVGSPGSNAVIVFENNGGVWEQVDSLPMPSGLDSFGTSMALDGDLLLVGALDSANSHGVVVAYRNIGGVWTQEAHLTGGGGTSGDGFGASIAIDGDLAVIGAPMLAVGGQAEAGAGFLWEHNAGTWTQAQAITATDYASEAHFGTSVDVDGDEIVVGAPGAIQNVTAEAGSVYRFVLCTGTWLQDEQLFASDYEAGAGYGDSVALNGAYLAVGASSHDLMGNDSGKAYLYKNTTEYELEPDGLTPSELVGTSIALASNTVIVGAPGADSGADDAGAVYVFDYPVTGGSGTKNALHYLLRTHDMVSTVDDMMYYDCAGDEC